MPPKNLGSAGGKFSSVEWFRGIVFSEKLLPLHTPLALLQNPRVLLHDIPDEEGAHRQRKVLRSFCRPGRIRRARWAWLRACVDDLRTWSLRSVVSLFCWSGSVGCGVILLGKGREEPQNFNSSRFSRCYPVCLEVQH